MAGLSSIKNKLGATALMLAAGDSAKVKLLLNKGAEVNTKAKNQISVTDTASGWLVVR